MTSYIDANIVIAMLNPAHEHHLAATALMVGRGRRLVVSPFVELEVVPFLQRNNRALVPFAQEHLTALHHSNDVAEALTRAMGILSEVNMGLVDAIHVGCALVANCDELITTEEHRTRKGIHRANRFLPIRHLLDAC